MNQQRGMTVAEAEQVGSRPLSMLSTKELRDLSDLILSSDLNLNSALLSRADCRTLMTATTEEPNASPEESAVLGRQLMGFFRAVEWQDPAAISVAMAAIFSRYPSGIGRKAVDPVAGLPGRLKFAPSLAEVREHLESLMAVRRAIAYRARWMLEEHDRREAEAALHAEREDPAVMENRRKLVEALVADAVKAGHMDGKGR